MYDIEEEEIYYTFKLNMICAVKNIISLICFTILAVVFNKWWLVLLSVLFLSSVSKGDDD